jgi:hypothetical protein
MNDYPIEQVRTLTFLSCKLTHWTEADNTISLYEGGGGYEVPGMILLRDLKWSSENMHVCPCFNLHRLQFHRINTSFVEVVTPIRRVSTSRRKTE